MLISSLIKDKTITLLYKNKSGNIIINKLINSLKNKKVEKSNKKNHLPLYLKNSTQFYNKNMKEKKLINFFKRIRLISLFD